MYLTHRTKIESRRYQTVGQSSTLLPVRFEIQTREKGNINFTFLGKANKLGQEQTVLIYFLVRKIAFLYFLIHFYKFVGLIWHQKLNLNIIQILEKLMQAPAGKKGNENRQVVLIPQLFNSKSQDTVQVKPAQVKPTEPRPYLKRGQGSNGSESLKRINRMNEEFGKNEGQGFDRKSSKAKQNSHIHLPQIPVHIPSDSDTYKIKPTIKKFVIRSNKTVKSQVPPHEPSAISDLSQKKPTDKEKYQRLLQNLKISIKTKDMKVEDLQRQFSSILYLFNNLVRDLQKKIEFHKAGPQRSERYQAKRRKLQQKLEQAEKDAEEYQNRLKKFDLLYKEADSKNDPKAEKWAKFRLQDQRSLDLCKERIESLKNQRQQLEKEISQGVQVFTFQKIKLLKTQKDHTEIQKFIRMTIWREIEPELAALRREMDQLQDQKMLITEKMHKAQEKEMSVKEMKQLKAEYNDVEKKIEKTEQDIKNNEEALELYS